MRWCVALVLVSGVAHAETKPDPLPIGAVVTAGIGTAAFDDASFEPITAVQLDVGVRIRNLMPGLHVAFNSGTATRVSHSMSMYSLAWLYTYRPMQIGLTTHVVGNGRFYAMPWLGVQLGWRREECRTTTDHGSGRPSGTTCIRQEWGPLSGMVPALGFGFGADTFEVNGHRIAVTATASFAMGGSEYDPPYRSVWLGVGYRFWDR